MIEKCSPERLIAELHALSARLQVASEQFQIMPAKRRAAAGNALGALSEFVGNVFPIDQELRLPLNHLLYGLYDLDHGVCEALLRPRAIKHRPKLALVHRLFRACAAALMDILIQQGIARGRAASATAKKLNELGYRDDQGQRLQAKSIVAWRNDVKAGDVSKDPAVQRYRYILELLDSKHPGAPVEAERALLGALPGLAVREILKKTPS
jgi:hypothetical protein